MNEAEDLTPVDGAVDPAPLVVDAAVELGAVVVETLKVLDDAPAVVVTEETEGTVETKGTAEVAEDDVVPPMMGMGATAELRRGAAEPVAVVAALDPAAGETAALGQLVLVPAMMVMGALYAGAPVESLMVKVMEVPAARSAIQVKDPGAAWFGRFSKGAAEGWPPGSTEMM